MIEAPVERVWELSTTSEGIESWMVAKGEAVTPYRIHMTLPGPDRYRSRLVVLRGESESELFDLEFVRGEAAGEALAVAE